MGSFNLRWCHSFMIVLISVGLARVLPLPLHGSISAVVDHDGAKGVSIDSNASEVPPRDSAKPYECGVDPRTKEKITKLELTAVNGLKFKCATSLTLGPASGDVDFPEVYAYSEDAGGCDTQNKAETLESVFKGAKLTKSLEAQLARTKDPVYTLTYTNAPDEPQTLCYTCNKTTDLNLRLRAPQASTVECTILIHVEGKIPPGDPNGETAPDIGNTKPPTSTSGAGAVKASAATAAIGLLLMVSRL